MRILVVEDEHRLNQSIKKGLEQERYVVDSAFTGTEGYDLASTESYDVILLDIMLPGLDGVAICKKLRENHNHTPILLLTAKGQVEDKIIGFNSGADDYLTKPFSFEELLARVRALIRRPKQIIDTELVLDDIRMNTHTFTVTRQGKPIALSHKEYTLLEYLMRHPNQIIKKDDIISHVWDYDADILPNTVEVYIRNLRNKIDVPFGKTKPLIQTVRGFGYKIGKK